MKKLLNSNNGKTPTYANHDGSLALSKNTIWGAGHAIHSVSANKFNLKVVLETLKLWKARSESRRELAFQDDHILTDIGLTRADVEKESMKWFWQS